ncbi:MAG TPA: MmgE/PrpD family protein [Hyphomonadaceae bacterium]|nr:MmgE/PrpD family protein [Hyphomonadaceae bacterium]
MTGLTLAVARHIATARDIPSKARRAAERSLLDAVGVMLGATALGEDCGPFADLAQSAPGPSTILGRAYRAQPLQAALANGALAHALDYEDALDGAPVHPNAAVVPVAMAMAEARPDISGAEFVSAVAIGCDLVCRLGLALQRNPDDFGWYPPPILSTFGAAAAASRLLKLDETATAHALALALAQATFSSEFKTYPTSSLRAVRDAFAAHAGLLAAMLAQRGVRGHTTAFEGKAGFFAQFARGDWNSETVAADLGVRFHGEDVSYKPWPSCRGTHAFIEAALHLRPSIENIDDIVCVEATGPPLLAMLVEPLAQKQAPATAIDAKFSLPFCVGAALATGDIGMPTFFEEGRRTHQTLALAKLVQFKANLELGMKHAASGDLAIRLKDGRMLSCFIKQARGSPVSPLTDEALIVKFLDCASYADPVISRENAMRLAENLLSMSAASGAAEAFAPLRD